MAQVFPFAALRYDPRRVALASVVTQPYDKITPEMQARYYAADPHNLVRVVLGRSEPGDSAGHDVYSRAAGSLDAWRRQGVLVQDTQPAIYRYTQRFTVPGGSRPLERTGFIALGGLEDYERGVVYRHELTHTAPKADRLNLLRATRTHCEQLFMVYPDPQRRIDSLLATSSPPDAGVTDEYGVVHSIWKLTESRVVAAVTSAMADKKLIIADGHHRYETALTYRNERRAQAAAAASGSSSVAAPAGPAGAPYERVMMTFVNMEDEGLCILPTHRLVHSLPRFDSGNFVLGTRQHFAFEQLPGTPGGAEILERIGRERDRGIVMAAVTAYGSWIMRYRPETASHLMTGLSARQQQLDVAILHRVVLETMLGISPDDIRSLKHVAYYRDAQEAIGRVRGGDANAAFLLNPVSIAQMRDVALAGEVMPQKSTDFYPKLLSGLVMYALD